MIGSKVFICISPLLEYAALVALCICAFLPEGNSYGLSPSFVYFLLYASMSLVFNPPFIHKNTLADYDVLNVALAKTKVRRFVVDGELLDMFNQRLEAPQHRVGKETRLCGSSSIPMSSIFGLLALFKKFIPGVGIVPGVLAPLAEKSLELHLMKEVFYGLENRLLRETYSQSH